MPRYNYLKQYVENSSIKCKSNCPRCGNTLVPSDVGDYSFQCLDCDEDFFSCEVISQEKNRFRFSFKLSHFSKKEKK